MELKTRTNQPVETGELEEELGKKVAKIEVTNIEQMSDEQLDALKVGDVVQKITGNMKHCYIVTYKEEKHGICLSYFACGYLETISYDYTDSHWVFNSKDVCETQEKLVSGTNIKTINGTSVLGSGDIEIPGGGGTKLYKHTITGTGLVDGNDHPEVDIPFDYKCEIVTLTQEQLNLDSDLISIPLFYISGFYQVTTEEQELTRRFNFSDNDYCIIRDSIQDLAIYSTHGSNCVISTSNDVVTPL